MLQLSLNKQGEGQGDKMRGTWLFTWAVTIAGLGTVLATPQAEREKEAVDSSSKPVRTDRYGDPLPENALARIGSPRLRDSSNITSVVFSSDGKNLFTCARPSKGFDGIACWETSTGKLLRRIPCQKYGAHCLALSPDGKTLAVVSEGRNDIWLIDIATQKPLRRLGENIDRVTHIAAAFSPDGSTLASCGAGGVLLWNVKTGALDQHLTKWGASWGLAWSPDGKLLAGVGDCSGRIGDVSSGKELWSIPLGKRYAECSVAFAPNGSAVAFGDEDGDVRLVEPTSGKELRRFSGHKGPVPALAFTPDGKHLASGGQDATVRIWDLTAAKEKHRFRLGRRARGLSLAFAPDGLTLASGSSDQTVQLWNITTGKEMLPLSGHRDFVTALAFSPDGRSLASGDFGGNLLLTDPAGLQTHPAFEGHSEPIKAVAFAPDGKTVVSGCWGGKVILWDKVTGKEIRSFKGHSDRIYALAFSPDGKKLASASIDSTVRLWDPATGKEISRMEGGAVWKWVTSLAFSADGRTLASAREDGTVRLCEVASGKEIRRLEGHEREVTSIASSSDGRHLVSAGEDRTVRVWEWNTGKEVRRLEGSEGRIRSVHFSPDGRTVVAGDENAVVLLWEVASRQLIGRFKGHQEDVYSVAFSPDGRIVASGSRDFTILLWDVTSQGGVPSTKFSSPTDAELWEKLAEPEARQAHQALWRLVSVPTMSVPMLRKAIRPVEQSATKEHIARLVAELGDERFAVREKASGELEELGELALPSLREALASQPTPELNLRAQTLLRQIVGQKPPISRLRLGRALSVLEQIGTRDAREVLESLAKGAEGAWLTNEAQTSMQRLDARAKTFGDGKPGGELPR